MPQPPAADAAPPDPFDAVLAAELAGLAGQVTAHVAEPGIGRLRAQDLAAIIDHLADLIARARVQQRRRAAEEAGAVVVRLRPAMPALRLVHAGTDAP